MSNTCEVCRAPLFSKVDSYWTDCVPCERATKAYARATGDEGDPDYAYHELAHHIVLFRRLPHRREHWRAITDTIRRFTNGRAQLHELHVIALQATAYTSLGWRPSIRRLVCLSWQGIAAIDHQRGRQIIRSEAHARDLVRQLIVKQPPCKSVNLYTRALRALRGELPLPIACYAKAEMENRGP